MKDIIDPTEIVTIKSNSPVTITFTNGTSVTAYNFEFKDLTHYATRGEGDWYSAELEVSE